MQNICPKYTRGQGLRLLPPDKLGDVIFPESSSVLSSADAQRPHLSPPHFLHATLSWQPPLRPIANDTDLYTDLQAPASDWSWGALGPHTPGTAGHPAANSASSWDQQP